MTPPTQDAATDPDGRTGRAGPLLATLDAALPGRDAPWPDLADDSEGLEAAQALHDLLALHGLTWCDVLPAHSRLAKLCGRLGSSFPGERAAAYHHAVLLVQDLRASWSVLLRLPGELLARPHVPAAAAPATPRPARSYSAPDGDWKTTIAGLLSRAAWRSPDERRRLDALDIALRAGADIGARDVVWLRDLWWFAELAGDGEATG